MGAGRSAGIWHIDNRYSTGGEAAGASGLAAADYNGRAGGWVLVLIPFRNSGRENESGLGCGRIASS